MFLSYLKIAWKVLLRRKFFTAISLFGISFTLMILLVMYSFYDHTLGPQMPENRVARMLFISQISLWGPETSSDTNPSYSFLERYVRPMRTPERVSISTGGGTTVAYVGNTKLKMDQRYTDAEFWQVLDFDFVEGRAYSAAEVQASARVAVLNERTARNYFGTVRGVVGRTIVTDEIRYQVVGVVRDVPATRVFSYAEIWMPITTSTENVRDPSYLGSCQAILLAPSVGGVAAVQQEFERVAKQVPIPKMDGRKFTEVRVYAGSLLSTTVRSEFDSTGPDDGVAQLLGGVAGLTLLFMLLPALNLVNINVSRIFDRSSEIGVRKAFGATSHVLIGQFLVENLVLTLVGGVLGLGLAAVALHMLNSSGLIAYTQFGLNGRVFLVGLGAVFFFGVLSGVYPAYKMSKLSAVQALKGGTNG